MRFFGLKSVRGWIFLFLIITTIQVEAAFAGCEFLKVGSPKMLVDGNRIYLLGAINDQDVLFMVDTGALYSLLLPESANELGLKVISTAGHLYGATGSDMQLAKTSIDKLSLGAWSWNNIQLLVLGKGKDFGHKKAVALLGQDFLRHFDVEIDIQAGVINIFMPKGCEDDSLAYWAKNYNVADMLITERDSDHILINAKANDANVIAMLDSGSPVSSLTIEAAHRAGLDPDSPGVIAAGAVSGIGGVQTESWLGKFGSFTLDQETIKPAKLIFYRQAMAAAEVGSRFEKSAMDSEMILGADFIRSHHILISNSQRKVYFTYSGGAPFQSFGPRLAE